MSCRIPLVTCVILGLLLAGAALVILMFKIGGNKVSVSFLKSESTYSPFPSMVESERLDFAVRNGISRALSFEVSAIQDANGKWVPSHYSLGDVEARQSTQLYLYLPKGSHPRSLRMRLLVQASGVQKAQFALRLLIDKVCGRYTAKTIWFPRLKVPGREFIVNVPTGAEPQHGADAGQPFRSVCMGGRVEAGPHRSCWALDRITHLK